MTPPEKLVAAPVVRFTAPSDSGPVVVGATSHSSGEPLSATHVVDSIMLVVESSALKSITGNEALRGVLEGLLRELRPQPERLVLQPLWDLLSAQPGFDRGAAIAPMCRLALLQARLRAIVELPKELRGLSAKEIAAHAETCPIDEAELERRTSAATAPTMPPTRETEVIPDTSDAVRPDTARRRPRMVPVLAASLAASLLCAIAIMALAGHRGSSVNVLDPRSISTEIQLSSVRKSGAGIVAVAADPERRRSLPLEARRAQLLRAGGHARELGAKQLLLVDRHGTLLALVSLEGEAAVMFSGLPPD